MMSDILKTSTSIPTMKPFSKFTNSETVRDRANRGEVVQIAAFEIAKTEKELNDNRSAFEEQCAIEIGKTLLREGFIKFDFSDIAILRGDGPFSKEIEDEYEKDQQQKGIRGRIWARLPPKELDKTSDVEEACDKKE